jgi:hypothetical protein
MVLTLSYKKNFMAIKKTTYESDKTTVAWSRTCAQFTCSILNKSESEVATPVRSARIRDATMARF